MSTPVGAVSDPRIVGGARRLRAACWALEGVVFLVVAASVAAIGSVHPWAYVPLWFVCLGTATLLLYRDFAVRSLRQLLGCRRFAFHLSDRWITLDADESYGMTGWSFDLGRPVFPRPPLLMPGLVFLAWVLLQLVPVAPSLASALRPGRPPADPAAWRALTFSVPDTLRGLAFLASALTLHVVVAALDAREARERFRRALAVLGLVMSLVALVQLGSGTTLIYGFFRPLEGYGLTIFGPFVNRNHFAGYMLMVVPVCFGLLLRAYRHYSWRAGDHPNLRRRLLALSSPEGVELIYALAPALVTVAALLATTSRGGLLAFVASLSLAGIGLWRKAGVPAWALIVAVVAVALSWFGLERLETRFAMAPGDAVGRTLLWRDSVRRMDGLWLTGSGFNTFAFAMTRVTPWPLPRGATAWPEGLESGVRSPDGIPGLTWFREAHNDYLQVLVETGIPGLALALWGGLACLRAARKDPWVLAALAGVLLHVLVDFDLQIPAIAVLFVVLSAAPPR